MNKYNARDYLPLVQALAEGKTIQYYSPVTAKWHDEATVDFNHPPHCYRIKPERIKKKMWYYTGGDGGNAHALYPVKECVPSGSIWSNAQWQSAGWKIVEVEFDAP